MTSQVEPLLQVRNLHVSIPQRKGQVSPLRGVDLDVRPGETLGIVGESGSGKTMTALAIMGLLPGNGVVSNGSIMFDGKDLVTADPADVRRLRGTEIGMIFQDPMTSLNPTMTIGNQIGESLRIHRGASKAAARERAIDIMRRVGMPRADKICDDYPHQLSGGMRQRAMIAMALVCHPKLLIADEPTTALDVTTQLQILDLLDELKEEFGSAVILVTHDLAVVAGRADTVAVMYAGRVMEHAPAAPFFESPEHQYTRALLAALPERAANSRARLYSIPGAPPNLIDEIIGCPFAPRCERATDECRQSTPELTGSVHKVACYHPGGEKLTAGVLEERPTHEQATADTVLEVDQVSKRYPALGGMFVRRQIGEVSAVDDVSFQVGRGETFGLVGESGCGKSTLGRVIAGLEDPTDGHVIVDGDNASRLKGRGRTQFHRKIQMMFQDSAAAMDPRMRVDEIIAEPLAVQGIGSRKMRREKSESLVDQIGLPDDALERYPHEFSGGQLQRIGLARALALNPDVIVCDEPVSALDVSVQAQVLNQMRELQEEYRLSYLFISHDLAVVRYMADRIGVMYLGVMVEIGAADDVSERPLHPYTRGLIDAVPRIDEASEGSRERFKIEGELPSAMDPPSGCRFRTRCPFAQDVCAEARPQLEEHGRSAEGWPHLVACHFPLTSQRETTGT
ncbi:dipeptide ABC transporter ATP-binding protein [Bowdeniella nasicola]|uniref:Dipeptide ABC transporter ATP-binding protein n=1 Tax=Bowdeniella nasicola TaxID=208480 RepID=A0A1Q5Q0Y4_9ACTO|nr:ABC transporter ATP-binding protein [Bowdeniella nasicola]OKL53369.1 dipeptide ABC transporter ATP-binding protein [Bowdeniella nasicola]